MIYIFGSHPVQDFNTWKPVFDSDQARATAAGVQLQQLFQDLDNPNNISMLFSAPSKEVFDRFCADPTLGQLMQQAGVLAPPVFHLLHAV